MHPIRSNAFVKARYLKCIQLMKEVINLKGKKVLDLGCGDGVLSYLLWKEGAQVYGIDNSDLAIKFAIEKHKDFETNCRFSVTDCCRTGFDANCFDSVVCSDVIEHVSEPLKLLGEIKRVLKPGGHGVLSTPIRITCKPLDRMHIQEWFQEEFIAMCSQIFPYYDLYESHPVFWMDFMRSSTSKRVFVNILSLFNNPFIRHSNNWKYYALQYLVVRK